MIPIRKFLIIFQIYLRFLFGREVVPGDIKSFGREKFENLKYTKDLAQKLAIEADT